MLNNYRLWEQEKKYEVRSVLEKIVAVGDRFELFRPEALFDSPPEGMSYNYICFNSNTFKVRAHLEYIQLLNGKIVPITFTDQFEEWVDTNYDDDGFRHEHKRSEWKKVRPKQNIGVYDPVEINEEMIYEHIDILISELMKHLNE